MNDAATNFGVLVAVADADTPSIRRPGARIGLLVTAFVAVFLLSWPIVLSLNLYVLKDRGSFLNLDYLVDKHYRLGVDVGYSYGLLPVLLQHVLFVAFGRGYWPMVGCALATLLLMALFWDRLLRVAAPEWRWLAAIVVVSPIVLMVNPNFPYSLVIISLLFALLLVLQWRLDAALAVSAIGCLSVPSLPLVLAAAIAILIVVDWRRGGDRSVSVLARRFAPGVIVYVGIALLLAAVYGPASLLSTLLPLRGLEHYQAVNYGPLTSLMMFLHPEGAGLKYYLFDRATWWVLSTALLFIFGIGAARAMIGRRELDPRNVFLVLCAGLHAAFVFVVSGPPRQHGIYDPLLVAGVLVGLAGAWPQRWSRIALAAFIGLAVLGHENQVRSTMKAWKETRRGPLTAGLYASSAWTDAWSEIVRASANRKLLLLSYGSGVHHYYPSVHSPDVWFLMPGLVLPAQRERVLADVDASDVIVQALDGSTAFVDSDPDLQRRLRPLCARDLSEDYRIYWRRPTDCPVAAK